MAARSDHGFRQLTSAFTPSRAKSVVPLFVHTSAQPDASASSAVLHQPARRHEHVARLAERHQLVLLGFSTKARVAQRRAVARVLPVRGRVDGVEQHVPNAGARPASPRARAARGRCSRA
jgi:hypothetical protein